LDGAKMHKDINDVSSDLKF